MPPSIRDRIHRIWDRLAEFPEPQLSTLGLQYLLGSVSELIDAHHAYWLSSLHLRYRDEEQDPMLGWRPGPVFHYREMPEDRAFYRKQVKATEDGNYIPQESTINHLRQAGNFRATLLRDHVSPEFFRSEHYQNHFLARGISDTLYVVAPVNTDTEVYFCFNRIGTQHPFDTTDLDIAADTIRCLGWFHKKVLLGHGLLVAHKPLTATERKVMQYLLTELAEKQIAERLKQKPDTTHKHICNIYRKFNINSRAALMAIWLGRSN
ncbi:LuxR C-terminal-related transcriptional regulator [Microbulbifer sp. SAOS-129_SWC]|uniref:helix-turn-helix transcriptional regulator n=1 Tax=Microbulbifer sp. SAOS-129_SWC TaxID=3145235 RepID=UPI003216FA34